MFRLVIDKRQSKGLRTGRERRKKAAAAVKEYKNILAHAAAARGKLLYSYNKRGSLLDPSIMARFIFLRARRFGESLRDEKKEKGRLEPRWEGLAVVRTPGKNTGTATHAARP